MTKKQHNMRTVNYESIKKISKSVVLNDIQTVSFAANCTQSLRGIDAHRLHQEINIRSQLNKVIDKLAVIFIEFNYKTSLENAELAIVNGVIVAVYEANDKTLWVDSNQAEIEQFAEINGVYNTWSYIRELVGSSLTRLGLTGVLLPLWRPPQELPPKGEYTTIIY